MTKKQFIALAFKLGFEARYDGRTNSFILKDQGHGDLCTLNGGLWRKDCIIPWNLKFEKS